MPETTTDANLAAGRAPVRSWRWTAPLATRRDRLRAATALALLLAVYFSLQFLLPLRTAIQLGGDEGFELAKASLCLKGYKLYSEVWNDQPPLHTFVLTQVLKHVSPTIFAARVLTSLFATLLLIALYLIVLRVSGLVAAILATGLLIASPGFLTLSSSCMLEIPALSFAVAALCALLNLGPSRWHAAELLCGALFGIALQMKLVPIVLVPLV